MLENLNVILKIQRIDLKLMSSIRKKHENLKKLQLDAEAEAQIESLLGATEQELADLDARIAESQALHALLQKSASDLTKQTGFIKGVKEYNLLAEKTQQNDAKLRALNDELIILTSQRVNYEAQIATAREHLHVVKEESGVTREQIQETNSELDVEIREGMKERELLAVEAEPSLLKIYERLLRNKRKQVVVPIQNRFCNACNISITVQQQTFVKKGNKLSFCENCNSILYWNEETEAAEEEGKRKRRTRRKAEV